MKNQRRRFGIYWKIMAAACSYGASGGIIGAIHADYQELVIYFSVIFALSTVLNLYVHLIDIIDR